MFTITLTTVAIMLAYAVPGFWAVKVKLIKKESISSFAAVLLYICQPCLTIYTLNSATYTYEYFIQVLIFFGLSLLIQGLVIVICYFIFRKKGKNNVMYRVGTVACAMGNCGFLGVPLLEAMLPNHPEAVLLSIGFLVAMNIISWTLVPALITGDKKNINFKKAIFNPTTLGLAIGIPLIVFNIVIPVKIFDAVTLVGRFSAPLCMLILGMRMATVKIKNLFISPYQYLVVFIKQLIMPLFGLLLVWFLPLDLFVKQSMYILCATPIATMVLAFSEMIGEGQEESANMILLGTILSILTLPLLMLVIS